jgi:hypothetical protein
LAAAAQGRDEVFQGLHGNVESEFAAVANA